LNSHCQKTSIQYIMAAQLISADNLAAAYGSDLILYAEGKVSKGAYDIHFERAVWMGGLKFRLVARQLLGPLGEKEYKYHQKFQITLPSIVYPMNSVIIVTANNPDGKVVPINWLGKGAPPSVESNAKAKDLEADEPPTPVIKPGDTRYVILEGELKITERIVDLSKAYLKMDFDKHYLTLIAANIDDGEITWTFKAIQVGRTPITLSGGSHGIPSAWLVQLDVVIFLPFPQPDSNASAISTETVPEVFYDFKEKILKAQDIVRNAYPDAELKIAEASIPIYPANNVYQLTALTAIFTSAAVKCTVTIKNDGTPLNSWPYPPTVAAGLLLGVASIDMTKLKVPLEEAAEIMEKHGQTSYFNMVLSHPIVELLSDDEPRYRFELDDRRFCYVGAMSGSFSEGPLVGLLSKDVKAKD